MKRRRGTARGENRLVNVDRLLMTHSFQSRLVVLVVSGGSATLVCLLAMINSPAQETEPGLTN